MNLRTRTALAAFVIYAGCIPAANYAIERYGVVPVGFGLMAPAGVYLAGIAFTARDMVQRLAGRGWAALAILTGVVLSVLVADPRLALASALAFGLSEALDMAIFTATERWGLSLAVLSSNTVGIVVDSIVFLSLAFGSLAFLPGQLVGKAWMTLLALAVLLPARSWMRHRAA
jgi:queuosine precursor transporter